ncbi:hypothetical protein GQ53DRAFT_648971 [Thozetella sp. PMI_491]|nr:hypothetical protein GQ53DRAFT_648971 [Thozetella sp. PMI_491]
MATAQDAYSISIPISPPPPSDLGTYARTMHQHTKKQMEAISTGPQRRSRGTRHGPPSMPNGVSTGSRDSRSPSEYSYQT